MNHGQPRQHWGRQLRQHWGRQLRQHWGLILATAGGLIAYGGLVRLHRLHGTLRDGHTIQTVGWYLLAFAAFVLALAWVEKRGLRMRWLWAIAVLYRLLLLFTSPTLSDDVYRYLWDGHVAANGVSPYAYMIDAQELDYLDVPQRAQANNRWMASPYLPVAQWVFSGLAVVFPLKPIFMQVVMTLFDLAAAYLILKLLLAASLPGRRLILYLWNPLVIVESAHGAHVDAWMVLLLLLALWFSLTPAGSSASRGGRWTIFLAPLCLGLATLTKILPVLLLPVLFWSWSRRQLAFFAVVVVSLLVPSALRAGWGLTGPLDGTGLFGALRIYNDQWNFNSGLFHWLEVGLKEAAVVDHTLVAKRLALAAMVLVVAATWLLARQRESPKTKLRLAGIPFMAYLLLTTTVHPWYALILLAFLPFLAPGEGEPRWLWLAVLPWLYLSGALIFSYLTYLDPLDFRELEWVRQVEWLPTLALLALAGLFRLRLAWRPTLNRASIYTSRPG